MPTRNGALGLLDDAVAQRLLQSRFPARLAYPMTDGTLRETPVLFQWNGSEVVFGTFPGMPKLHGLRDGAKAKVTIDTSDIPCHVLIIRGSVRIEMDSLPVARYPEPAGRALVDAVGGMRLEDQAPTASAMARLVVTPEWVGMLSFKPCLEGGAACGMDVLA